LKHKLADVWKAIKSFLRNNHDITRADKGNVTITMRKKETKNAYITK